MTAPVLHLLAGPNGAGKSTLYERVLGPSTRLDFVNADVIAADRWPGEEARHGYDASVLAQRERTRRLASRQSFVTETVFSHPSKIDLVQVACRSGYHVILHVIFISEELAVRRVQYRVRNGGHFVPEDKIRERYGRLWAMVRTAVDLADESIGYDNSSAADPYRRILAYRLGEQYYVNNPPNWLPVEFLD